jgi:hypothetical protein
MKISQHLKNERAYVEAKLTGEICARCGATLKTFSDKCSAGLSDTCPGFWAIDNAKADFNRRPRQEPKP